MKRSAALTPLSHDHQHALAAALRLRRATPESLGDAVAGLQDYLTAEGERHFEQEERLLLPALPPDDPEWAPMSARILAEHAALRSGAADLDRAPTVARAREVGELLSAHVRFEEREAFPLLEERLAPEALARLGAALSR